MEHDSIRIVGAREHNLKDVTLSIPKNQITVFTGVSGSGKSSSVFDTIAVEGQRQLNGTFSWFIRNQLPRYERPLADAIDNLTTPVIVDQNPVGGNARSTVGTMTDIYSMIRALFARHGKPSDGLASGFSAGLRELPDRPLPEALPARMTPRLQNFPSRLMSRRHRLLRPTSERRPAAGAGPRG